MYVSHIEYEFLNACANIYFKSLLFVIPNCNGSDHTVKVRVILFLKL